MFTNPIFFALVATLLINAILFIQSGADKVFDFQGNLGWLKGHFSKSIFKNSVPFLLVTLTFFEITTGVINLLSVLCTLFIGIKECEVLIFASFISGSISLIALFLGQRIAKDYAGAASLIPYFLMQVLGFILIHLLYA